MGQSRQMRNALNFYNFVRNLQQEMDLELGRKPSASDITFAIVPIVRKNRGKIKEQLLTI